MELQFTELCESDLTLLARWLKEPHVKRWWDDGEITLETVKADYGPEEGITRYVLSIGDEEAEPFRPCGFFQHYKMPDEEMGIDLFIGEPELVNRGIGTVAVKAFCAMIFEKFGPSSIFLDPHPENSSAIRCYQKAGFVREGEGLSAEGEPAVFMRLFPEETE